MLLSPLGLMNAATQVVTVAAVVNLLDNATPTLEGGTTSYNAGTHTITATGAGNMADWQIILSSSTTYTFTANYTMSSGSKLRICDNVGTNEIVWTSAVLSSSGSINITFTTGANVNSTDFFLQADTAGFSGTISSMVVHV